MKTINATNFNENKIYAFRAGVTPSEQYHKQYGNHSAKSVYILAADRTGINDKTGGDYNEFKAVSIGKGKQNILPFSSFGSVLEILAEKNIDLYVFDTVAEFAVWLLTDTITHSDVTTDEIRSYMENLMPNTLAKITRTNPDNIKRYGCDNCGWVYDDTDENLSFYDLGENFVCPDCGAKKMYFTKIK